MAIPAARVKRLFSQLTAAERAALIVAERKQGRKEDMLLHVTAPSAQTAELRRLLGLIERANWEIAVLIFLMRERVERLTIELRYLWALEVSSTSLVALDAMTAGLGIAGTRAMREEPPAPVDGVGGGHSGLSAGETLSHRVSEISASLREQLRTAIPADWRAARAIQVVLSEVAGQLNGEDPSHPYCRQCLDEVMRTLCSLHGTASDLGIEAELAEPSGEDIECFRRLLVV
jgi:hypothetical protein